MLLPYSSRILAALAFLAGGLCVVPDAFGQNAPPVAPKADPLPRDARFLEKDGYVIKLSNIRVNGREFGGNSVGGNKATISFDYSVYFKTTDGTPHPTVISQIFIGIGPQGKTFLNLIKQGQGEVKGSFSGDVPFASEDSGGPTQISVNAYLTMAFTEAQGREFIAQGKGQFVEIIKLSRPK